MSNRELRLGSAAEDVKISYPHDWDPSAISGLTLTINDRAGAELVASTAASIYTQATLDGDVSRYSREVILSEGDGNLSIGDRIRITGVEGYEDHVVKGWDATSLKAELEDFVDVEFESGATVDRLHAVATVDISDDDIFTAGKELLLIWTPTGTGAPFTETGIVYGYRQVDIEGFDGYFKALYPRAYSGLKSPADRLSTVKDAATETVRKMLIAKDASFDISKLRDQSVLKSAICASCAVKWTLNGDKALDDERKYYMDELLREIEYLVAMPIWVDGDNDNVEDAGETTPRPHVYHIGW